jgi:acetylornithine aminotransferase/acetylornithine/N-succinyldiaminopimelate aminotransferase
MAGISATAQQKVKEGFAPLLAGFKHLPFNDLRAVENAVGRQTVAILVEPVQGEGGIYPASREFLLGLREICDRNELLLMLDEIQCGVGRLGKWCGWSAIVDESFVPDCVSWAKGIGGGFPLGATWVRKRSVKRLDGTSVDLCDILQPGTHGTTYGGTPLACSASLAVLETIEQQDLLANASHLGSYAKNKLKSLPGVADVRGIGLMLGIELGGNLSRAASTGAALSQHVVTALMKNGLLSVPAGPSVIRWLPPLNVSQAEVDEALSILARTLAGLTE